MAMTPEERFEKIEELLEVVTGRLVETVDVQRDQAQIQRKQTTALLELTEKLDATVNIADGLQRDMAMARRTLETVQGRFTEMGERLRKLEGGR